MHLGLFQDGLHLPQRDASPPLPQHASPSTTPARLARLRLGLRASRLRVFRRRVSRRHASRLHVSRRHVARLEYLPDELAARGALRVLAQV